MPVLACSRRALRAPGGPPASRLRARCGDPTSQSLPSRGRAVTLVALLAHAFPTPEGASTASVRTPSTERYSVLHAEEFATDLAARAGVTRANVEAACKLAQRGVTVAIPIHFLPSGTVLDQLQGQADRKQEARKAEQQPEDDPQTERDDPLRLGNTGTVQPNCHDSS